MKGDFSKWGFDQKENFNGVLHQQGRVLLDSDWNAQTQITLNWQDQAAQDAIGRGVAAVPEHARDGFKVISVDIDSDSQRLALKLTPGRVWADGILTCLPGKASDPTAAVVRMATILQPPLQDPDTIALKSIKRVAVILEVWREAINGFQNPELLEPALGGPDTTERVHTAMAFRLFNLAEGETCQSIHNQLQDDFSQKGKLTVSLKLPSEIPGDCPVVEEGGYTGFEHYFYRIEIAQVHDGTAMFKWSQFNGGLVGRGIFLSDKVQITANRQAIISSGLDEFYLETVEYDDDLGHWRVTYGAEVTLNSDNDLELPTTPLFGTIPGAGKSVFFRLWNGICPISKFSFDLAGAPIGLRDGIHLSFDSIDALKYQAGDYWTFQVRAGEIQNPEVLIDNQAPQGIHYHRVPLAELKYHSKVWEIEDCREIFHPLTNLNKCCTFSVGDGIHSQGDFNSVEEALKHLPPEGGEICLLRGVHHANAYIKNRKNIRISGCGKHTAILPRPDHVEIPIFVIQSSQCIQLDHLTLFAPDGSAILLNDQSKEASWDITIADNDIVACKHAIVFRANNGLAGNNRFRIVDNFIGMVDKEGGKSAIFSIADEVLIERNKIVLVPSPKNVKIPELPDIPDIFDPCTDPKALYGLGILILLIIGLILQYIKTIIESSPISYLAEGGIQIGRTSERVKIIDNEIIGGKGNGITLGDIPEKVGEVGVFGELVTQENQKILVDALVGDLYEISIEGNHIQKMGLSGIGGPAFFNLEQIPAMIAVNELTVYRNQIKHCAHQTPEIPLSMLKEAAFGGIVISDCETAIIRENRIEENGLSHVDPICGIFILHGEKVEISDNRILYNGPRKANTGEQIKSGPRAGIYIGMSFTTKIVEQVQKFAKQVIQDDGIPAAKIHDNIVIQPLGRTLDLLVMGNVSVINNQLTSQDIKMQDSLFHLGGAVSIINLGISNNLAILGSLLYYAYTNPQGGNLQQLLNPGLFLPDGNTLFHDNQTTLNLGQSENTMVLCSQLIFSMDDVSYCGNQSTTNLWGDLLLTDVLLFAPTVRTCNNRFKEDLILAIFSLLSLGMMNTCTNNQSTRCILPIAPPNLLVDEQNREMFPFLCDQMREWF